MIAHSGANPSLRIAFNQMSRFAQVTRNILPAMSTARQDDSHLAVILGLVGNCSRADDQRAGESRQQISTKRGLFARKYDCNNARKGTRAQADNFGENRLPIVKLRGCNCSVRLIISAWAEPDSRKMQLPLSPCRFSQKRHRRAV